MFFLHEHPRTAKSWDTVAVRRILALPKVGTTVCGQCQCGLTTWNEDGSYSPALKPTMWMSNSPMMLSQLGKRCDMTHEHTHLMSGRAKEAENYPRSW